MNKLEKAAVLSVAVNAVVSLLKFAVGSLFGSIALIADAIHSFTDIVSSIALFFGVRFSDTKSEKFPYGLYKLENLVSLFIALLIFYGGIEIVLKSWSKLFNPTQITSLLPIGAAIASLLIVFVLARYKQRIGREENSPSMLSDARHSMLDAYGTIGVIAGVLLSYAGFPIADPLIGLIIGLLVFKAGASILVDSSRVLLDASLDFKSMRKIQGIVSAQKNVKIKELNARNSGRYVFVDLKLETGLKDLKRVDQLHKHFELEIKKAIPRIDKIMIDIEYRKKDKLTYAVPLKKDKKKITHEFGTAPFFGLFKVSNKPGDKKLLETKITQNPHATEQSKRGILTAGLLAKKGVDVLFSVQEMSKGGAFYALQENFIEVRASKAKTMKELLEEFKEGN